MNGISYWFLLAAALMGAVGMVWGIQMSATHDHTLAPAHAHLNLVGWVTMALFGLYYHLVPQAGQAVLARVHLALALAGVLALVPGIVMALTHRGDALAKLGSVLTVASMLVFIWTVARNRGRPGT